MTTVLAKVPHMAAAVQTLNDSTWPEFLLHGDVRNWSSLYTLFADFQLVVLEEERVAAAGMTVPFSWGPGRSLPRTIDEVVFGARWPLPSQPGVLCALAALVSPLYRRRGLSRHLVAGMVALAAEHELLGVIAPVRPTDKHRFPREAMGEYCARRDETGRLTDPWLRVHEELGGQFLGICEAALTVRATVSEWESWTGLRIDRSGECDVAGALVPVAFDLDTGTGEYREPNVWYFHPSKKMVAPRVVATSVGTRRQWGRSARTIVGSSRGRSALRIFCDRPLLIRCRRLVHVASRRPCGPAPSSRPVKSAPTWFGSGRVGNPRSTLLARPWPGAGIGDARGKSARHVRRFRSASRRPPRPGACLAAGDTSIRKRADEGSMKREKDLRRRL